LANRQVTTQVTHLEQRDPKLQSASLYSVSIEI